ncbi:hypothetical protein AH860_21255 [Salmonella enterica subsp. enterica serovar Pomona]|uniref:hypothetical protein n=1 Tax=Salmonella enterica TaxID=28901 RepID=UPI0012C1403B|nr:hypothetical protein [Salmonella enterica subsp. enterica serovar Minnesota]EAZ1417213.1 hypothetical protein [Salmonella enterica]EBZ1620511.1 hypothetical protein [Salmonella enterica subsp. enterica serovar Pomona]EDT8993556.1 hypothetical protein [Salmonella enterica subsp. enterica serovar Pomona]
MHINDFPEVYHGQGISEAVFPAPARRVTNKVSDTTYRITGRLIMAYVVVRGLRAGWKGKKILFLGFSDLRKRDEQEIYRSAYEF